MTYNEAVNKTAFYRRFGREMMVRREAAAPESLDTPRRKTGPTIRNIAKWMQIYFI